jgi:hypothetical protein
MKGKTEVRHLPALPFRQRISSKSEHVIIPSPKLAQTSFFGAKSMKFVTEVTESITYIKAKIPSYLVPSSTKQQAREWCSTPETHKKSGGSRPITPNCFGHKPKIGSKQKQNILPTN